jgi:hypothetical protein
MNPFLSVSKQGIMILDEGIHRTFETVINAFADRREL